MIPLVLGVRGFIPQATYGFVKRLVSPQSPAEANPVVVKDTMQHIMHILFREIVKIYKAWSSALPNTL